MYPNPNRTNKPTQCTRVRERERVRVRVQVRAQVRARKWELNGHEKGKGSISVRTSRLESACVVICCDGCTYFLKPFPPRGKRREEKGGSRRVHATCLQVEICTATCPDYRCRIPAFRYSKCYLLFISHIFLQLGVMTFFFFFEMRQNKTYSDIAAAHRYGSNRILR